MFPFTDPQFQLDLYYQRSTELRRAAHARRLAHTSAGGGHRRFGRWPRPVREPSE
jgi:hypothetical protein